MKTILVDAVTVLFLKTEAGFEVFRELHDLLERFPNRKIAVTNAPKEEFKKYGLDRSPYEVFTLEGSPDKTDPRYFEELCARFGLAEKDLVYFEHNLDAVQSAGSRGIASYYYDAKKKDLGALKKFLLDSTS